MESMNVDREETQRLRIMAFQQFEAKDARKSIRSDPFQSREIEIKHYLKPHAEVVSRVKKCPTTSRPADGSRKMRMENSVLNLPIRRKC